MSLYKVKLHAKFQWGRDYDIYKFEFEEKNTKFDKSTIIWNILKIHWIIVLMEGAVRDAFEDEQ